MILAGMRPSDVPHDDTFGDLLWKNDMEFKPHDL